MAIIPRASRQVDANAAPLRPVDTGADRVGQAQVALGRGIGDLGEGVGGAVKQFALTVQKERDDLDDFQTKIALTKYYGDQERRQDAYDHSIAGDGRDHTANRLAEVDQGNEALLKSLPNNKRSRQMATLQLQSWRNQWGERSYKAQTDHIDVYKTDEVLGIAESQFLPEITDNPETARAAVAKTDAVLASTDLPEARKSAIRKAVGQGAYKAWFAKAGADAPAQADAIIKSYGERFPQGEAEPPVIRDMTGQGAPAKPRTAPIQGVVIHHTAGSTLQGALDTSRQNGNGANYYIDRDSSVVKWVPEDQQIASIQEPGSRFRNGSHPNLNNANTISIEVVAKNDADVTPDQRKKIQRLVGDIVKRNRLDPNNVVGHGEIQGGPGGNREPDEGTAAASEFRDNPGSNYVPPSTEGQFVRWLVHDRPQIEAKAAKLREQIAAQQFVQGAVEGRIPFNPFNDDHKKIVNKAYEKAEVSSALFAGDEGAMRSAVEVSQKLNYVPESVSQSILGLVSQNDPTKRATGYRAASAIMAKTPYAFDAAPNGTKLRQDAEDYTAMVTGGLAPDEAIQRLDEMNTPEWKKAEAVRKVDLDGQDGIKASLSVGDFTAAFDNSFLGLARDPTLASMGPEAPVAFKDFQDLVAENYIRHGDVNLAKTLALGQMKRMWGVSTVNGTKTVTRYPIEKQYPDVPLHTGNFDYIGAQLAADVKAATGKDVALSSIVPRADDQTQRELASGRPSYVVIYRDENGVPQRLPGRWHPDVEKAQAEIGKTFAAEHAAEVERLARPALPDLGRMVR